MADVKVRGVIDNDATLNGEFTTLDNVYTTNGQLFLVTGKANAALNGIYIANSAGTWTRDLSITITEAMTVRVLEGTTYGMSEWLLTTIGTITLDTTAQNWQLESWGEPYEFDTADFIRSSTQVSLRNVTTGGEFALPTIEVDTRGRVVDALSGNVGSGYIEGLGIRASATEFFVSPGAAYIPGINRIITITSERTVTRPTSSPFNTANNVAYVYLYEVNGVGQIEVSTTAPDTTPYIGSARTKAGDTSRRYLGTIINDSTTNIMPYDSTTFGGATVLVLYTTARTVATTTSTTVVTVTIGPSAAAAQRLVSPVSRTAIAQAIRNTRTTLGIARAGWRHDATSSQFRILGTNDDNGFAVVRLSTSQDFRYDVATAGADVTFQIAGYYERR